MVKLAMLLAILAIVLAVVGVYLLALSIRHPRPKPTPPKEIKSQYKPEDLTWLYAQGVSPEEIRLAAEQNRLIQ